jgi:hypothetical protein
MKSSANKKPCSRSPPSTATIRETTSTSSRADRICAELQDAAFDLRPLDERRFLREACNAEREAEAQEELFRESGALDSAVEDLNENLKLPADIEIVVTDVAEQRSAHVGPPETGGGRSPPLHRGPYTLEGPRRDP